MPTFECQEVGDDSWTKVANCSDHEDAAKMFAEQVDCENGGDRFYVPGRDEMRVIVRRLGDACFAATVVVSFDYTKDFYSYVEERAPLDPASS